MIKKDNSHECLNCLFYMKNFLKYINYYQNSLVRAHFVTKGVTGNRSVINYYSINTYMVFYICDVTAFIRNMILKSA